MSNKIARNSTRWCPNGCGKIYYGHKYRYEYHYKCTVCSESWDWDTLKRFWTDNKTKLKCVKCKQLMKVKIIDGERYYYCQKRHNS